MSEEPTPPERRRALRRKWLLRAAMLVGGLLAVCLVASGVTYLALDEPRPTGREGEAAEDLAREVQAAVGVDAFRQIGAIHFVFGGRRSHLWDQHRGYDLVTTGDQRVYLRVGSKTGRVFDGDTEVTDRVARRKALDGAYAAWANDTFWLNPFPKLFDPGTRRATVDVSDDAPGMRGLLVSFASGGVTPGDAYLFLVDEGGRPTHWRMWVRIIPVGGVEVAWERWQELPGGALVSTRHPGLGPVTLELTDVRAADTPATLVEGTDDPFAVLAR